MQCRNYLCALNRHKERNCHHHVVKPELCVRRKLFERIVREGHGMRQGGISIADEARGARLMMELNRARKGG